MGNVRCHSFLFRLFAIAALSTPAFGQTPLQTDMNGQYLGTWRFISGKYAGREFNTASDVTIKHITPSQFTWLSYDKETGKIRRAGGGTYSLSGNSCTENIQYGIGDDYEVIKGKPQSLQIRVEQDRLYSEGKLSNGTEFTEVWERVK